MHEKNRNHDMTSEKQLAAPELKKLDEQSQNDENNDRMSWNFDL